MRWTWFYYFWVSKLKCIIILLKILYHFSPICRSWHTRQFVCIMDTVRKYGWIPSDLKEQTAATVKSIFFKQSFLNNFNYVLLRGKLRETVRCTIHTFYQAPQNQNKCCTFDLETIGMTANQALKEIEYLRILATTSTKILLYSSTKN